nr:hypothetical protein [uncultured Pseudomonas sp.]
MKSAWFLLGDIGAVPYCAAMLALTKLFDTPVIESTCDEYKLLGAARAKSRNNALPEFHIENSIDL